jgi:hypothetical protein
MSVQIKVEDPDVDNEYTLNIGVNSEGKFVIEVMDKPGPQMDAECVNTFEFTHNAVWQLMEAAREFIDTETVS